MFPHCHIHTLEFRVYFKIHLATPISHAYIIYTTKYIYTYSTNIVKV